MLDQCAFMLEGVALAEMIELVVEMLVDLAAVPVLLQQAPENAKTPHPQNMAIQ